MKNKLGKKGLYSSFQPVFSFGRKTKQLKTKKAYVGSNFDESPQFKLCQKFITNQGNSLS